MNKTLILISTLTIAIFSLLIVAMVITPNLDSRTSASVDQNLQDLQNIYNSKVSQVRLSASEKSMEEAQKNLLSRDYTSVCWNNVIHETESFYWKNGCKGDVQKKDVLCTEVMTQLTTEELFMYMSWLADGSKLNNLCNQVLGIQNSSVSSSLSSSSSTVAVTNYESCKKYDLNLDKLVNSKDLNIADFNKYLNKKVTTNKYDFDGNKIVNAADLTLFVQSVADFAVGNNCK